MTIYYVDTTTGIDTDSGLTEALAKKTIGAAVSASINGDTIYVKNSAVYNEAVVIPVNTGRLLIGYASIISDKGRFILDGTGTLAVGITMSNSSGASILNKLKLANIEIKNYTSHGTDYIKTGGDFNNAPAYANIWSHNNGGNGFNSNHVGGSEICYKCKANNNIGDGFSGLYGLLHCVAHDNGGDGFLGQNIASVNMFQMYCISYGNTGAGYRCAFNTLHCIAYNNGSHGIVAETGTSRNVSLLGNISTNNGGWGYVNGAVNNVFGSSNLSYLNTSGDSNLGSMVTGISTAIVVNQDPLFTDAPNADFSTSDAGYSMGVGLEDDAVNITTQHAGFFDPAGAAAAVTVGYFG